MRTLSQTSDYIELEQTQENFITVQTFIIMSSVIFGSGLSFFLRMIIDANNYILLYYIQFPGRILSNMMLLVSVPLTASGIISGMTGLGNIPTGRLMAAATGYYMSTSLVAIGVGILLMVICSPVIQKKTYLVNNETSLYRERVEPAADFISQTFPRNLVKAWYETVFTEFDKVMCADEHSKPVSCQRVVPSEIVSEEPNYLAIILVSLVLGSAINYLQDEALAIKGIVYSLNSVLFLIARGIMWYAPIGLVSLLVHDILSTKNVLLRFNELGNFIMAICGGLFMHGFIILPIIYVFVTHKNPLTFALYMSKALFTALVTSSSHVSLPFTVDCLVRSGIKKQVANLLGPIGASLSKSGTALYQAATAVFLAIQSNKIMGFADVLIMSIFLTFIILMTSLLPAFRFNSLATVLLFVGLPLDHVSLLLTVDWILSHFQEMINVWSDCVCAGIFDHYYSDYLEMNINHFDFRASSGDVDLRSDLDSSPTYSNFSINDEDNVSDTPSETADDENSPDSIEDYEWSEENNAIILSGRKASRRESLDSIEEESNNYN